MSFLNSDVKIFNTNKDNKKITLELNNKIYDNNSNKILDEVINTICLSLNDNYDINEISFTVDNEEIYKSDTKKLE